MKVLVTGGAGFIGSHTCCELIKRGHEVLIFDNLANSAEKVVKDLHYITGKVINFYKGDIRSQGDLNNVFREFSPHSVIHFAGLKSVNESVSDPLAYFDVNCSGTVNLLRAMKYWSCNKIIFSSSATVYGKPDYLPLDEKHKILPLNPYGRSKVFVEDLLKDLCFSNSEFKAVSLRYFNPIGAHSSGLIGESPPGTPNNLMPKILDVVLGSDEFLTIYGDDFQTRDGTGERDYVHITDLANAHVAALEKQDELERFNILNLGTGRNTTVFELISIFEKVSGKKIVVQVKGRRAGDVGSCWANSEKAQKLLDVTFNRSVEDMCRDVWGWVLTNRIN